jgi:outer membrane protein OmpA-like peptidoglycan-associated protein
MLLRKQVSLGLALLLVSSLLSAAELQMTALTLPGGKSIDVNLSRTSRAPGKASMRATLLYEKGQTSIALSFEKMEPALLFAGDISSYVLWAVSIDGTTDNLGEVAVDRKNASGSQQYYTTKRILALMVTAEPYTAVRRPTEVVLFKSGEVMTPGVKNTPFTFSDFQTGPKPALESIASFQYADDTPVAYKQAQKVLEAAAQMHAADVNPTAMSNAKSAFASADNLFKARGDKKEITDFSRIAVQLASQAIVDTVKANEAKAAAEAEAKRQAEKAALEERAQAAETETQRVARELKEVQTQREALALESKDLLQQRDKMAAEKEMIAAERDKVAAERDAVAAEREAIRKERDELARTLRSALSTVAETNETARGVIVSLPGILFDLNKATLKIASQLTIAKLAGILMVFQNMNLSIEGYTDSTGTDELNMALSGERAQAVYEFLKGQGITDSRMKYQGFGSANPVAPNDTEANRAKNRRVEVVLTHVKQ